MAAKGSKTVQGSAFVWNSDYDEGDDGFDIDGMVLTVHAPHEDEARKLALTTLLEWFLRAEIDEDEYAGLVSRVVHGHPADKRDEHFDVLLERNGQTVALV